MRPPRTANGAFERLGTAAIARRSTLFFPLSIEYYSVWPAFRCARQRPGHTLQSSALVHEAYLRLIEMNPPDMGEPQSFFCNSLLN